MNQTVMQFQADSISDTRVRLNILLVNANLDEQSLFASLLDPNWTTSIVGTADEAIAACDAGPPDCVLIDFHAGQIDGLRLVSELRNNPRVRYVPIVILSANLTTETVASAFKSGIDDYLNKLNMTAEKLQNVILQAYNKKSLGEAFDVERHALVQENHELTRRHELFEKYWAGASHSMLTNLSSINEFVSLLLDGVSGPITEEQGKCLALARGSCLELQRDIKKIVDITQMARDPGKLVWSPQNLAQIIEAAVDDVRLDASAQGVALMTHLDESAFVFTDQYALSQALYLLIQQAVALTPANGQALIYSAARDQGKIRVCVRVQCKDLSQADAEEGYLDWQLPRALVNANASELDVAHVAGGVELGFDLLTFQSVTKQANL
jgi:CheY-like chemotaxis protein